MQKCAICVWDIGHFWANCGGDWVWWEHCRLGYHQKEVDNKLVPYNDICPKYEEPELIVIEDCDCDYCGGGKDW